MSLCGMQPLLTVVSLVYLVSQLRRRLTLRAALPLLLNLGSLYVFMFGPTSHWVDEWQLQRNWEGYTRVIQLVEAGQLQPTGLRHQANLTLLPPELAHVSCEREVAINHGDDVTRVFFFSRTYMLGTYEGFMYRSDDRMPDWKDFQSLSISLYSPIFTCRRVQPSWFACFHGD